MEDQAILEDLLLRKTILMASQNLQFWDYLVIAIVMAISIAIGFYFRIAGNRKQSCNEYLMGGGYVSRFPVVFSLVVSKLSAVSLIGEPAEIYLYGTQRCVGLILVVIGSFVTAYVYLPVYFAVRAPTIYQLLYMSIVLYTPALALNSVTNLSTETSIVIMGLVCTVFSSIGGFRGILWNDVFQAILMYAFLVIVLVFGTMEAGGVLNIYRKAQNGHRFQFWNFSVDPSIRYTFWNAMALGIHSGVVVHAVNQVEVQRLLAIRNLKNSQSALLWSALPSCAIHIMSSCVGIVMYVVFSDCNPLSKESGAGITKADQIVPYYIASRLRIYPGLSGLCISGIFSGAMTSVSSAVNSLSVVAMDDFLLPNISLQTAQRLRFGLIAKLLVIGHGLLIIGFTFFVSSFRSLVQGVVVLNGMILGPSMGLYTLGMLTRGANEKGGILGVMAGVMLSGWIGIGSSFSGKKDPPLPLSTEGCSSDYTLNVTVVNLQCCNSTDLNFDIDLSNPDQISPFYRVSFMWISFIGLVTTIVVGYIASRLIGLCTKPRDVDIEMLSPVMKWCKKEPMDIIEIALTDMILRTDEKICG